MQILLKFYIWLQSYEQFRNTQNNIKQKDLNSFFADISKTISATSDSFPLIMSMKVDFSSSSGNEIKNIWNAVKTIANLSAYKLFCSISPNKPNRHKVPFVVILHNVLQYLFKQFEELNLFHYLRTPYTGNTD